jgi:hypothetical protein
MQTALATAIDTSPAALARMSDEQIDLLWEAIDEPGTVVSQDEAYRIEAEGRRRGLWS